MARMASEKLISQAVLRTPLQKALAELYLVFLMSRFPIRKLTMAADAVLLPPCGSSR
jgi:hypothetical protein